MSLVAAERLTQYHCVVTLARKYLTRTDDLRGLVEQPESEWDDALMPMVLRSILETEDELRAALEALEP